jgi:hypothetical protein
MRNKLKQTGRASAGNLAHYGERLLEGELAAPPPERVGVGKALRKWRPRLSWPAMVSGQRRQPDRGWARFARADFARRVGEAVLACADPAAVAALLRPDG